MDDEKSIPSDVNQFLEWVDKKNLAEKVLKKGEQNEKRRKLSLSTVRK